MVRNIFKCRKRASSLPDDGYLYHFNDIPDDQAGRDRYFADIAPFMGPNRFGGGRNCRLCDEEEMGYMSPSFDRGARRGGVGRRGAPLDGNYGRDPNVRSGEVMEGMLGGGIGDWMERGRWQGGLSGGLGAGLEGGYGGFDGYNGGFGGYEDGYGGVYNHGLGYGANGFDDGFGYGYGYGGGLGGGYHDINSGYGGNIRNDALEDFRTAFWSGRLPGWD